MLIASGTKTAYGAVCPEKGHEDWVYEWICDAQFVGELLSHLGNGQKLKISMTDVTLPMTVQEAELLRSITATGQMGMGIPIRMSMLPTAATTVDTGHGTALSITRILLRTGTMLSAMKE